MHFFEAVLGSCFSRVHLLGRGADDYEGLRAGAPQVPQRVPRGHTGDPILGTVRQLAVQDTYGSPSPNIFSVDGALGASYLAHACLRPKASTTKCIDENESIKLVAFSVIQ